MFWGLPVSGCRKQLHSESVNMGSAWLRKQRSGSEKAALYKGGYTVRAAWPAVGKTPLRWGQVTTIVGKREAERGTHSLWAEQACQDLTGVSASQPPTEHAAEPCNSRSGWHPTSPHLLAACQKLSAPLPRPSTSMSAFSQDSYVISFFFLTFIFIYLAA